MNINVNDIVKFRLSKEGKKTLKEWGDKQFDECSLYANMSSKHQFTNTFIKNKGKGWYEAQLWRFMNIFGKHFYNGCEVPIENNLIVITEKDTK
jgi:hypothetical protein